MTTTKRGRRTRTLLVVDWDTFFRNPLEAGDGDHKKDALLLYDWGHREAPFFIDGPLWQWRAGAFLRAELPLPQMDPRWRDFARRFRLSASCRVLVADSNSWAGTLGARHGLRSFTDVWLYDAHHDCYRSGGSLTGWLAAHTEAGQLRFSCEDWMFVHAAQGARLHHRFPAWRMDRKTRLGKDYPALPDDPPLRDFDGALDDPANDPPGEIDQLFICRSGAWVPPWCDGDFCDFVASWGRPHIQLDTHAGPLRRAFVAPTREEAMRHAVTVCSA